MKVLYDLKIRQNILPCQGKMEHWVVWILNLTQYNSYCFSGVKARYCFSQVSQTLYSKNKSFIFIAVLWQMTVEGHCAVTIEIE